MKTNLLDLSLAELSLFVADQLGEPPFRAKQLWQWLWKKRARTFDCMTDISLAARTRLKEAAEIVWPEIVTDQQSADGTVKLLLRLHDGSLVETVLIPATSRDGKLRMSQCLSCQVGCAMGCTFCSTGALGFTRNMSMGEILGQVLVAREFLNDDYNDPLLKNIVFMGMGEPLLNPVEMMKSLRALNNDQGLCFSPRRITVSTCGIQRGLLELGESNLCYLAVSLHAPTQELRAQIMPRAAAWNLDEMLAFLKNYPLKARERLTFEYLLLGGVNDSPDHARAMARILSHIKGKLNIIVYNPSLGSPYRAPSPEAVLAFQKILWNKNIVATLRKSKGQDIDAACGQLCAKELTYPQTGIYIKKN
jgi:23S rRNA m2A2503 methyltransferase